MKSLPYYKINNSPYISGVVSQYLLAVNKQAQRCQEATLVKSMRAHKPPEECPYAWCKCEITKCICVCMWMCMISVIHYANLPATTLATQSEAAVGNGSKHVTLSYSAPAKLCLHRDENRALRRMHVCVSIFSFLLFFLFL